MQQSAECGAAIFHPAALNHGDDVIWPTHRIIVAQWSPRLYALEKSEPPPRVMPVVLAEWNLRPATDPKEVAVPPVEDPKRHRQASYQKILTGAPK